MADKQNYQSAALAALTAAEGGELPPEPENAPTPEGETRSDEIVETDVDGKLESVEESDDGEGDGAPKEDKPPAPKPEEKQPSKVEKTWEQIAKEKREAREARKAAEQANALGAKGKAMLAAAEAGDAMGLLAAAGISWSQAAKQVIDGGKADPKAPAVKKPEEDENPLAKEVRELKAKIAEREAREQTQGFLSKIKSAAAAAPDRFLFVSELEAEEEVFGFLQRYAAETGELPGDNVEESIEIALEAVEKQHRKKAEKYQKGLTKLGSGNKSDPKKAAPSTASKQQVATTLTNDAGAGPRSVNPAKPKVPKTEKDYQSAALASLLAASAD